MKNTTRKPPGYWTVERALEAAKNYRIRSHFKKGCPQAYMVLLKNKHLDKCGFDEGRKQNGYYTKETVFDLARECRTRTELQMKSSRAYHLSLKNGWLSEMDWLEPPKNIHHNGWNLYRYEFEDGCVYYGITTDLKERDREHRGLVKSHLKSAVYKHHIKTGLSIPVMKVLRKNLSVEDARKREYDLIISYREKHPSTALNVALGGSVGGTFIKWGSYKDIEQEARKYRTKSEFMGNSPGAYDAARKFGILDKFTFFEDGRKIYRENHREIQYKKCYDTARLFNSPGEFKKNERNLYAIARVNGWLKDYTWLKRVQHEPWTKESIIEYVKDKGYKSLTDFMKGSSVVYGSSRRLGLTSEQLGLERKNKPHNYWSFDRCKEVGLKAGSRGRFAQKYWSAYTTASRYGWLDLIFGKK